MPPISGQDRPLSTPVSFSGPGDTAHGDVANEADRYSRPRPLTPSAGPSYDTDQYRVSDTQGTIITPVTYDRCLEYDD